MRLPFDLIAALLAMEAIKINFGGWYTRHAAISYGRKSASDSEVLTVLIFFWFATWLMHEWLSRKLEWRQRWGALALTSDSPDGRSRLHPIEFYGRGTLLIQVVCVAFYCWFLFQYRWNLRTCAWPEWLGLRDWVSLKHRDALSESVFVGNILDLGPYLVCMILAWIPKHRLVRTLSGRTESFWAYFSVEAKLTFLPFILWIGFAAGEDALRLIWPASLQVLRAHENWSMALQMGFFLIFAAIGFPWLIKIIWNGRSFPDGDLKTRFNALLKRSGVSVRSILYWGPKNVSLANACVLGVWSKVRYIMISPGLVDMLTAEECEAVIAHEIGHARHGHLSMLFALLFAMMSASGLLIIGLDIRGVFAQSIVVMLMIVLFLRVFFGMISRQCEREADLTSAELMGTTVPLITALEKLGGHGGGTREVYSWHHDSIAQRVTWLQTLFEDKKKADAQHARVKLIRRLINAAAILGIGSILFLQIWYL